MAPSAEITDRIKNVMGVQKWYGGRRPLHRRAAYWVSRKYYQSLDTKLRWNSLDRLHTVAAARAWNIGTDCRKQSLLHQPCIHSVEP